MLLSCRSDPHGYPVQHTRGRQPTAQPPPLARLPRAAVGATAAAPTNPTDAMAGVFWAKGEAEGGEEAVQAGKET